MTKDESENTIEKQFRKARDRPFIKKKREVSDLQIFFYGSLAFIQDI